jgi:hypothetical protein
MIYQIGIKILQNPENEIPSRVNFLEGIFSPVIHSNIQGSVWYL